LTAVSAGLGAGRLAAAHFNAAFLQHFCGIETKRCNPQACRTSMHKVFPTSRKTGLYLDRPQKPTSPAT